MKVYKNYIIERRATPRDRSMDKVLQNDGTFARADSIHTLMYMTASMAYAVCRAMNDAREGKKRFSYVPLPMCVNDGWEDKELFDDEED